MTKRLQQDHDNALMLAKGLAACPHIEIRTDLVREASYQQHHACDLCQSLHVYRLWYKPPSGIALLLQGEPFLLMGAAGV